VNFLKLLKNIVLWNNGEKELENVVHFLCGGEPLPSPLTEEKEKYYLDRLDGNERDDACNKLIEHNIRLVIYIAKRFENSGVDVEDLISIGSFGLIKAVKSFKNEKNIKLATYASRCIENEILMYFRKIVKTKSDLSLDEPLNVDYDGNELLLSDLISVEDASSDVEAEKSEEKIRLINAVNNLNEKEKFIMEMRFGLNGKEEYTQKQVADILGISQSYISRLEKRIFNKLKKELSK
jgi:RNA polymerase sporulation-specific sigma factor